MLCATAVLQETRNTIPGEIVTDTCRNEASLPIIAFVGSPIQYASFAASSHFKKTRLIVGHRGMPGDISFSNAVLNDGQFIAQLDDVIGSTDSEVFLPNAINALFLACMAHPRIKKISYLDEGHLTARYLDAHYKKKLNPFTPLMVKAFYIVMLLPRNIHTFFFKVLSAVYKRTVIKRWLEDSEQYGYQVIDRRFKGGVILSHLKIETPVPNVEVVDILKDVEKTSRYDGAVCVMLHPYVVSSQGDILELVEKLVSLDHTKCSLLLRPHPLFGMHQKSLKNFCEQLEKRDIPWQFAELSNKQETAVELYALGVRVFVLTNESTIGRTVSDHLSFFKDLIVIRV